MAMPEQHFQIKQYFERLSFREPISMDIAFVRKLQRAQLLTIPFENFDIWLGREIKLDEASLVAKLLHQRRGGYCSELNGLFLMALHALGFEARSLLGRVHLNGIATGRGHRVSLLTLDGQDWLVDTGFGAENPAIPIPIIFNSPESVDGKTYQLTEDPLFGIMVQKLHGQKWKNLYSFDLGYVCPKDIEYGNYYTSTNPNALFVKNRVAALPLENGMCSLFNRTLKIIDQRQETIQLIEEGPEYLAVLEKVFGIVLDAQYDDLKPLKLNNEAQVNFQKI
ncbi:MAG: arylamine N-acetyltransferase [Bacteroidetes bacterium]|nr:arylamine N-acetyltransferase [Bacteroidota bacterium]